VARGLEDAAVCLIYGVGASVRSEQARREDTLEQLRIDVEANGHEVTVHYDSLMFPAPPRAGWWAGCSCRWDSGDYRSETEARAAGGEHLGARRRVGRG
jgi:hypothetical protein